MNARAQVLTIGRLAKVAKVHLETVRYYEGIGLMPSPNRTSAGHRAYDAEHVRRLVFIRRARELGFGIEDIRALLSLAVPSYASCAEVREIARVHRDSVRAKLADLSVLEGLLSQTIEQCSGQAVPMCPILDMLGAL